ncbi:UNVERIFIED_CONTAM: hypothetical protein HDU68_003562 [Siphonaria sp. JEL0065]|nr:hypothetical protein HDU68_003562 [Siphonaria sp. JEL0065]
MMLDYPKLSEEQKIDIKWKVIEFLAKHLFCLMTESDYRAKYIKLLEDRIDASDKLQIEETLTSKMTADVALLHAEIVALRAVCAKAQVVPSLLPAPSILTHSARSIISSLNQHAQRKFSDAQFEFLDEWSANFLVYRFGKERAEKMKVAWHHQKNHRRECTGIPGEVLDDYVNSAKEMCCEHLSTKKKRGQVASSGYQSSADTSPTKYGNSQNLATSTEGRICVMCNTDETPTWRSGPNGKLCNACGMKNKRSKAPELDGGPSTLSKASAANLLKKIGDFQISESGRGFSPNIELQSNQLLNVGNQVYFRKQKQSVPQQPNVHEHSASTFSKPHHERNLQDCFDEVQSACKNDDEMSETKNDFYDEDFAPISSAEASRGAFSDSSLGSSLRLSSQLQNHLIQNQSTPKIIPLTAEIYIADSPVPTDPLRSLFADQGASAFALSSQPNLLLLNVSNPVKEVVVEGSEDDEENEMEEVMEVEKPVFTIPQATRADRDDDDMDAEDDDNEEEEEEFNLVKKKKDDGMEADDKRKDDHDFEASVHGPSSFREEEEEEKHQKGRNGRTLRRTSVALRPVPTRPTLRSQKLGSSPQPPIVVTRALKRGLNAVEPEFRRPGVLAVKEMIAAKLGSIVHEQQPPTKNPIVKAVSKKDSSSSSPILQEKRRVGRPSDASRGVTSTTILSIVSAVSSGQSGNAGSFVSVSTEPNVSARRGRGRPKKTKYCEDAVAEAAFDATYERPAKRSQYSGAGGKLNGRPLPADFSDQEESNKLQKTSTSPPSQQTPVENQVAATPALPLSETEVPLQVEKDVEKDEEPPTPTSVNGLQSQRQRLTQIVSRDKRQKFIAGVSPLRSSEEELAVCDFLVDFVPVAATTEVPKSPVRRPSTISSKIPIPRTFTSATVKSCTSKAVALSPKVTPRVATPGVVTPLPARSTPEGPVRYSRVSESSPQVLQENDTAPENSASITSASTTRPDSVLNKEVSLFSTPRESTPMNVDQFPSSQKPNEENSVASTPRDGTPVTMVQLVAAPLNEDVTERSAPSSVAQLIPPQRQEDVSVVSASRESKSVAAVQPIPSFDAVSTIRESTPVAVTQSPAHQVHIQQSLAVETDTSHTVTLAAESIGANITDILPPLSLSTPVSTTPVLQEQTPVTNLSPHVAIVVPAPGLSLPVMAGRDYFIRTEPQTLQQQPFNLQIQQLKQLQQQQQQQKILQPPQLSLQAELNQQIKQQQHQIEHHAQQQHQIEHHAQQQQQLRHQFQQLQQQEDPQPNLQFRVQIEQQLQILQQQQQQQQHQQSQQQKRIVVLNQQLQQQQQAQQLLPSQQPQLQPQVQHQQQQPQPQHQPQQPQHLIQQLSQLQQSSSTLLSPTPALKRTETSVPRLIPITPNRYQTTLSLLPQVEIGVTPSRQAPVATPVAATAPVIVQIPVQNFGIVGATENLGETASAGGEPLPPQTLATAATTGLSKTAPKDQQHLFVPSASHLAWIPPSNITSLAASSAELACVRSAVTTGATAANALAQQQSDWSLTKYTE